MLTDRVTLSLSPSAGLEPEDYLSTALGVIFPDDITNQHGDPSTPVIYTSPRFGKIFLSLADPVGETSRRLFAQYLWNAGVYLATALEEALLPPSPGTLGAESAGAGAGAGAGSRPLGEATARDKSPWDVRDETVLELGAGTGIAGIVAVKAGARQAVITDYPAPEVLSNLSANVDRNLGRAERERCCVRGHEWGVVSGGEGEEEEDGGEREALRSGIRSRSWVDSSNSRDEQDFPRRHARHFTRILLADCLWMPKQHANLQRSIAHFLSPGGYAIVVAGFHTGRARMAAFFDARALAAVGLRLDGIVERDAVGRERAWTTEELGHAGQGREDLSERKRWLVVAVLTTVALEEMPSASSS